MCKLLAVGSYQAFSHCWFKKLVVYIVGLVYGDGSMWLVRF